jgi:hypothetical protein
MPKVYALYKTKNVGTHESEKLTIKATRIDIDKVDAQNLRLVTVPLNDSFLINTCKGRLIAQINNVIIKAIKINSKIIYRLIDHMYSCLSSKYSFFMMRPW